ncbi:MAG: DUF2723 domain-containing protein [Anaerolineae bacterium]
MSKPATAPAVLTRSPDAWLAALLALLAGALYVRMGAPGVLPGDGGELQFAAWTAGLAHPTGYPLYLLLGWLWTHALAALHLATPARAMTLLSALFGALAVAFTYLAARALIQQSLPASATQTPLARSAATVTALLFALTPTFLDQAITTEVYTLHAALLAALLWLALRWRTQPDLHRLNGLALVFGLGLAHHRTTMLLAPVLLLFVWQRTRQFGQPLSWRRPLLLVLLPLLLYLYIPLRAAATPYLTLTLWSDAPTVLLDRSPAGLWRYLLGQSFAGEIQSPLQALRSAPSLWPRLVAEWTLWGVLLAAFGAILLAVRRQWALLWLTGGSLAVLAGFNLLYTIGDIAVFYIPVYLLAGLWVGVALAGIGLQIADRAQPRRWPGLMIPLLLAAPLLVLLGSQAHTQDRRHANAAETGWRAALAANPPQNAVLATNDRDEMMPLWYLQQVEGLRPDLAGVFPLLLTEPGWLDIGQTVDSALSTGRPVYLIKPMPGLEIKARLGAAEPSGFVPVFGPAVTGAPNHVTQATLGDAVQLFGYDEARTDTTLTLDLYWQALRPLAVDYTSFVQALAADGSKLAQSDHPVGGVYYPTSLWQPTETLFDRHVLSLPADAEPTQLIIGMYHLVDGELASLGTVTLQK